MEAMDSQKKSITHGQHFLSRGGWGWGERHIHHASLNVHPFENILMPDGKPVIFKTRLAGLKNCHTHPCQLCDIEHAYKVKQSDWPGEA